MSTFLAYIALAMLGLVLILQIGIELMLKSLRSGLAALDIDNALRQNEPGGWWSRVSYYIKIESNLPNSLRPTAQRMKIAFYSSNVLLGLCAVLFLVGNLMQQ